MNKRSKWMYEQQTHQMQLETTHPDGAEEWSCPTCGRRFLMQLSPVYKKVVLEAGDDYAGHVGSKGGIQMGHAEVTQATEESAISDTLRPWLEALKGIQLDDLDQAA